MIAPGGGQVVKDGTNEDTNGDDGGGGGGGNVAEVGGTTIATLRGIWTKETFRFQPHASQSSAAIKNLGTNPGV